VVVPFLAISASVESVGVSIGAAGAVTVAVWVTVAIGEVAAAAVCKGRRWRPWPSNRPPFQRRPLHVAVGRATTAAA